MPRTMPCHLSGSLVLFFWFFCSTTLPTCVLTRSTWFWKHVRAFSDVPGVRPLSARARNQHAQRRARRHRQRALSGECWATQLPPAGRGGCGRRRVSQGANRPFWQRVHAWAERLDRARDVPAALSFARALRAEPAESWSERLSRNGLPAEQWPARLRLPTRAHAPPGRHPPAAGRVRGRGGGPGGLSCRYSNE